MPTERFVACEKPWRSLVKAVSWRAMGTADTILISFLITGKPKLAISIGLVELFTKTVLYFSHERLWNRIALGRVRAKQMDYSI
jgi:uncharacterized membrane protein